jgi:hypothetical protein
MPCSTVAEQRLRFLFGVPFLLVVFEQVLQFGKFPPAFVDYLVYSNLLFAV